MKYLYYLRESTGSVLTIPLEEKNLHPEGGFSYVGSDCGVREITIIKQVAP
jgi:hypothetical protein